MGSAAVSSLRALRRARDRIDRDYAEQLDIAALAAEAGYSLGQFIRAFDAAYGETPGRYRTRRRVERACDLLRSVNLTDTPRGPVKFDHFGNIVGDFYIRKLGREGAKYGLKLWNKTVKTYHDVSQFWTYDEKKFLAQPVYSRDYPPLKP